MNYEIDLFKYYIYKLICVGWNQKQLQKGY